MKMQRGHALRVPRRDERRQQRTEGVAAEHDLLEPQVVQHADHIRRVLGDRVTLRRFVAQATATQVKGDHAEARREARVEQAIEVVQVGSDPGQQHDWRLAAGVVDKMKANAVCCGVSIDRHIHVRSTFLCCTIDLCGAGLQPCVLRSPKRAAPLPPY